MGPRKAEARVLLEFSHSLFLDTLPYQSSRDINQDQNTIINRVANEGISFLTKTLPKLGKAFDKALDTGSFSCPSELKRHRKSALPAFMRGLLSRIIDKDGLLKADPDPTIVYFVRQICYFFYKLVIPFTDEQERLASQKFKQTDSELPDLGVVSSDASQVLALAQEFLTTALCTLNLDDLVPSHGPGIVASGERAHEKRYFSTHYKEVHNEFPYYRFFSSSPHSLVNHVSIYRNRVRKEFGMNKVLFVPKDSRGPRTIACEPNEYMWVQQGLRKALYSHIEQHPLTKGRINFTDQNVNKELAKLASSSSRHLATVDLKDASDSVSCNLVDRLFSGLPRLLKKLYASRTPVSVLPDGELVVLKKFCAMGSAMCFPIEALCFYSLTIACYSWFEHLVPEVWVYGDDIVVNSEILAFMTKVFSELGLTINVDKSFSKGAFRESCGGDYFAGFDVTPIRCRRVDPREPSGLAHIVALSNNLFEQGMYKTALVAETLVSEYKIPQGNPNSPYLCFHSPRALHKEFPQSGYNKALQFPTRKVPYLKSKKYVSPDLIGEGEYLRKLTCGWSEDFRSEHYTNRGAQLSWKRVSVYS